MNMVTVLSPFETEVLNKGYRESPAGLYNINTQVLYSLKKKKKKIWHGKSVVGQNIAFLTSIPGDSNANHSRMLIYKHWPA